MQVRSRVEHATAFWPPGMRAGRVAWALPGSEKNPWADPTTGSDAHARRERRSIARTPERVNPSPVLASSRDDEGLEPRSIARAAAHEHADDVVDVELAADAIREILARGQIEGGPGARGPVVTDRDVVGELPLREGRAGADAGQGRRGNGVKGPRGSERRERGEGEQGEREREGGCLQGKPLHANRRAGRKRGRHQPLGRVVETLRRDRGEDRAQEGRPSRPGSAPARARAASSRIGATIWAGNARAENLSRKREAETPRERDKTGARRATWSEAPRCL